MILEAGLCLLLLRGISSGEAAVVDDVMSSDIEVRTYVSALVFRRANAVDRCLDGVTYPNLEHI